MDLYEKRRAIIARAESRGALRLNSAEDAEFRRLSEQIEDHERREELHATAVRFSNAAQGKQTTNAMKQHQMESRVYNQQTAHQGRSFWRDLVLHKSGDDATGEARARLNEHTQEQRTGLTTTADGASFVPPVYLEMAYIEAAIAAKPFISTIPEYPAPKGHQINVPKIVAPGTVGVQNPELSAVTNTDQTDEYLSTILTTIVGQQTVSRQLLDQSPIDIDAIIFKGLSQSWAAQQDATALYGTGSNGQYSGIANLAGITQIGWSGNTIGAIYNGLTAAIKAHWANRFMAPTTVLVHPNTAAEWLAKLDTTNRPLFVPTSQGPFNAAGIIDSMNAQGPIGKILGLDLVLDPNISSAGGVESVFVFRADDLMFFTSGMRAQVHYDSLASSLGVLLSLWSYDGLIARYPSAITELTGYPYGS